MANKEFYELKKNSIKNKYSKIIQEMSLKPLNEEEILLFKAEALEDIKAVKKEKYDTLKYFQKHIKYSNLIADILLFIGLCCFIGGLIFGMKETENYTLEVLFIVMGSVIIVLAAVAFGYLMHMRQKQQEYLKDPISESELGATKQMINDFCDEALQKINNQEMSDWFLI